jgi:hypothetical protein
MSGVSVLFLDAEVIELSDASCVNTAGFGRLHRILRAIWRWC